MRSIFLSIWMPLALFILWCLASGLGWVNPYLLPKPVSVYAAFVELIEDGTLFDHIGASLGRAFGGYFLAVLIALPYSISIDFRKSANDPSSLAHSTTYFMAWNWRGG